MKKRGMHERGDHCAVRFLGVAGGDWEGRRDRRWRLCSGATSNSLVRVRLGLWVVCGLWEALERLSWASARVRAEGQERKDRRGHCSKEEWQGLGTRLSKCARERAERCERVWDCADLRARRTRGVLRQETEDIGPYTTSHSQLRVCQQTTYRCTPHEGSELACAGGNGRICTFRVLFGCCAGR